MEDKMDLWCLLCNLEMDSNNFFLILISGEFAENLVFRSSVKSHAFKQNFFSLLYISCT